MANIQIENKIVSINGKKTFILALDAVTGSNARNDNTLIPEFAKRGNLAWREWSPGWCGSPDWRKYQAEYEKTDLMYTVQTQVCFPCTGDGSPGATTCVPIPNNNFKTYGGIFPFTIADRDAKNFFGYVQIDEPTLGGKAYCSPAELKQTYDAIKAFDPNHPVMVNHYTAADSAQMFFDSQAYADILCEDHYSLRSTMLPTEDFVYFSEFHSARSTFGTRSIDDFNTPVWAFIQANGKNTSTQGILAPTTRQIRQLAYDFICCGYTGLALWDTNSSEDGLWTNPVLWDGVKGLYEEIKLLNDMLVLPDVARSFHMHLNDTAVVLSPNPAKTVSGGYGTMRYMSYAFKENAGVYYLILVNKDATAIPNLNIRIPALAGKNATVRTIGNRTTGSERFGRILTMTNGSFSDQIDGNSTNIYEIAQGIPPMVCSFNYSQQ